MTTLAQLIAAAHVHRDALGGDYGFTIARKALLRVAERAGAAPTDVNAGDVVATHAALESTVGVTAKTFREEHRALERLVALPQPSAATARRIFAGDQTLADAMAAVELQTAPDKWKAARSGLRKFVKLASPDRTGGDVAATEELVERKLAQLSHMDFEVSPQSANTVKSNVRKAVRLVDLKRRQRLDAGMLQGRWRALVAEAKAMTKKASPAPDDVKTALGTALATVWPLVEHCWRRGVAIEDVDDATVAALWAMLEANGKADPLETARKVVYGWEKLQALVPGWPATALARVYQNAGTATPHDIPEDDLPDDLRAAWATYEARVFAPSTDDGVATAKDRLRAMAADTPQDVRDPLAHKLSCNKDAPASAPRAAVGARSRRSGRSDFKTVFLYAANAALVDLQMRPGSLQELFVPDVLNRAIVRRHRRQQLRAEAKGEDPPSLKNATLKSTVAIFKAIATDLGQEDADIEEIDAYYDEVHPDFLRWVERKGEEVRAYRSKRMGPTHRRMLEAFEKDEGDEKLLAWFRLPRTLYDRVRKKLDKVGGDPARLSQADFCDAITALVAAIMRSCPLRRENVGELRIAYAAEKGLGANVRIPTRPGGRGRIRLWAGEVKHGSDDMSVYLTPLATEIARFYLETIRPTLAARLGSDPSNPWLFPAAGMQHRALELITARFADRCWKAGFWMDLHCNRHLTAKIILDRDVTAMQLLQQILGHQHLSTTEAYYADVNKALADGEFQARLTAAEHDLEEGLLTALKRAS